MKPDQSAAAKSQSGLIRRSDYPATVFLVDDDVLFRDLVQQTLDDEGYDVTVASDGGEALQKLAAMVDARLPLPDVLILDFVMPRLSGLGVLRALARMGTLPPTLLLTGFPDSSVDMFARNLACRVLRKPIDVEELCAAVEQALRSGANADPLHVRSSQR